ncbi:hypothetical protein RI065_11685 [Mycoplasmatota bacterium zrk1]
MNFINKVLKNFIISILISILISIIFALQLVGVIKWIGILSICIPVLSLVSWGNPNWIRGYEHFPSSTKDLMADGELDKPLIVSGIWMIIIYLIFH